jgi:IS30 family transposase
MKYHHLTTDERCQIYALKSTGSTQQMIAEHLGVSISSVVTFVVEKLRLK